MDRMVKLERPSREINHVDKSSHFLTVQVQINYIQTKLDSRFIRLYSDEMFLKGILMGLGAFSRLDLLDPQRFGFVSKWGASKFNG